MGPFKSRSFAGISSTNFGILKTVEGVYQLELAPSYIQDKYQRDGAETIQIDEHFNGHGLIRMRIYSRYTRLSQHQLWIAFNHNMQNEEEDESILGYYCTCKEGARTLGSCAHVASVLWFLGFARLEPNVKYPWTTLLDVVMDAANRPAQINPNQPPPQIRIIDI